ncbi:MAG: glutamine-hydrolyzing carbamoyl-phosphate synthase small subunit [Tannerellaceae bacterium]|nr:glutamine-hydrolyzing carbamoyl-phosphate synthase small subunit [Tannerellaceae bacterium]MCD8264028.1 glutamine-hydrolyzing carbamoyl-phosphate synthase small subunit [Tannerellaceae bacterium]
MTQYTEYMQTEKKATLILDDGSVFQGISFGYEKPVAGEVVFNTAMTGYPESLTDPSYAGQLMVLTYPLVGNYGVPNRSYREDGIATFMESEKIHAEAIIISDYSHDHSHWNAINSLGEWLKNEQIPGIYGVDTRAITKILREKGSMKGKIVLNDPDEIEFCDPNAINQVARVSCKEVTTYGAGEGKKHVVLVDCGVKHNIIRCLLDRGVTVTRVPWDYDFNHLEYDGLFISNGPGDPDTCDAAVQNIRKALVGDKPICGICMGNQLLAKAGGASIFKLKYGHRSHNQPVRMVGTNRCFITSQNHGYAVDNDTLSADWEPLFINMNDGTNEGIRHKTKPFFSAQFHPEASSGPTDTEFIFDLFIEKL